MQDLTKELYSLEGKIAYHDFLYYNQDKPIISDSAYDQLVARYLELKESVPDFVPSIDPGFVGPDESLPTEALNEPMLSVDKYKNKETIEKWQSRQLAKLGWIPEEKIDGVALRLTYERGSLVKMNLRGDGFGTIVTHRVSVMPSVPRWVDGYRDLDRVEVSGEAYVTLADLATYATAWNVDSPESRSTISGMLKRKQPEESDTLDIRFKAFMVDTQTRKDMRTYEDMRQSLLEAGFEIPKRLTDEELEEAYNASERPVGEYAIDGIVVKNNDLSMWKDTHMKGYWTFMVCYKYPTCSFTTTLLGVDWKLNTKGYLEGTLVFEPVEYDGSTIRRAKFDYVDRYINAGLRIGSTIEITKANEIIPNLVGLVEKGDGEPVGYPKYCPSCNDPLEREGSDAARCVNITCPGLLLTRLERGCSPKGLNILNLGTKRLERLINVGRIKNIAYLFSIGNRFYEEAGIEDAIAAKVEKQLEKAKTLGLNNWLYALCIPHVGYTRATEIAAEFGTTFSNSEELIKLLCNSEEMEKRCNAPGLKAAQWCFTHIEQLEEVFYHYDWRNCKITVPDQIPVVCTGAWTRTRKEIKEILAEYGFNVEDGLSKSSAVLLVGDKPSPGTIKKAEKWNTPIIELKPTMTINELVAVLRGVK